jgi:hypothetical protein
MRCSVAILSQRWREAGSDRLQNGLIHGNPNGAPRKGHPARLHDSLSSGPQISARTIRINLRPAASIPVIRESPGSFSDAGGSGRDALTGFDACNGENGVRPTGPHPTGIGWQAIAVALAFGKADRSSVHKDEGIGDDRQVGTDHGRRAGYWLRLW